MEPRETRVQRVSYSLAELLALAGVYFVCGKFGLSLAFVNKSASAVWPPTGLALAVLLLWGPRLWPGLFLGAFLVNITTQGSFVTALGIATGNTLEALVGAALAKRFAGGLRAFERAQTIFRFVMLTAIFSTSVSATIGVTSLCVGGFAPWSLFGPVWKTWWLGDMVSDLILAPVLIVWATKGVPRPTLRPAAESAALLFLLVWVGQMVFLGSSGGSYPLEYLALLPLLWAAVRFGERGAATGALLLSAIALWGTRHGLGPFARTEPNESLLLLQTFMGSVTLTGLVLAAVISERRRAEAALRAAEEILRRHAEELEGRVKERTARLEESVQSLDSFCHSIAHDLRAPLRALGGFSNELFEQYHSALDETGRGYLARIRAAAAHMDRLILDLLKLGRLNSAELPLQTVALEEVVRRAMGPLEAEAQARGTRLRVRDPLLPVCANPVMVEQALSNLLSNALKFVPRQTPPDIEIWTEKHDEMVRVCVRDNGIGIRPELLTKLFRPFVRLVNGAEYPGTGIGLAIVRKAAERMGGRTGAESEPGKGSCFWVELPEPA